MLSAVVRCRIAPVSKAWGSAAAPGTKGNLRASGQAEATVDLPMASRAVAMEFRLGLAAEHKREREGGLPSISTVVLRWRRGEAGEAAPWGEEKSGRLRGRANTYRTAGFESVIWGQFRPGPKKFDDCL
jgi:hypothetical protein